MNATLLKSSLIAGAALLSGFALSGCDVDVKDNGKMPKVEVEPGRAPDVDVHGPEVDVGTKEKTITVPDVDVHIPREEEHEPANRQPVQPPPPAPANPG